MWRDAAAAARVPARAGWLSARARTGKALLYVSDSSNSVVDIFDKRGQNQQPIGQITDGVYQPNGITTDESGNLYVANSNDTLTVYPPGGTSPSATYTQGLSLPIGVVVHRNGRLCVANLDGLDVTEYPKGSTTPDRTIPFGSLEGNSPFGLALDSSGNLFVAALGFPNAQAYELMHHSSLPQDLGINSIVVMHGIAVDKQGNVLIANQGGASVEVFPPGSTTPSMTITDGLEQPLLISLDKKQSKLYVADAGLTGNGTVRIYSYPAGALFDTITFPRFGVPFGIAFSHS
jgi:sugar lactone lactonase YvrE